MATNDAMNENSADNSNEDEIGVPAFSMEAKVPPVETYDLEVKSVDGCLVMVNVYGPHTSVVSLMLDETDALDLIEEMESAIMQLEPE